MKLYRITLKLNSSLITPLKGDTIWGCYVWGIANHEGEKAVQNFLEQCKTEEPSLIVSSAFPKGYLCKNIPEVQPRENTLTKATYSQIKKNKKCKYIAATDFIDKDSQPESADISFRKTSVTRNRINRLTDNVQDGGLFTNEEMWCNNKEFDLYILSSYTAEHVTELTEWAFENGFGADASTGKGYITVSAKAEEIHTAKTGNKYMALGPFVEKIPLNNLHADTFVRSGKVGGAFSSDHIPWKKTVVMYDEGAVFESDKKILFVGELISDVHVDKRICNSGFAPVIPIV